MNKIRDRIIKRLLRRFFMFKGMSPFMSIIMSNKLIEDFFEGESSTITKRIWAYRHGFFIGSVKSFHITTKNYKEYLSSYDYYMMFPINGSYRRWIDDKLTLRLVLEPFKAYLPKYYYHIMKSGEIIECVDNDYGYSSGIEGIIEHLEEKGNLILKPCAETKGHGIMKLTFNEGQYFINGFNIDKNKLTERIRLTRDTIITEYVTSHSTLSMLYTHSSNSLRIAVVRYTGEKPQISHAIQKFGTTKSGTVDNSCAGGIYSLVDLESGNYKGAWYDQVNMNKRIDVHPDSGLIVEGTIPNWGAIKSKVVEICNYIPQVIYMGVDIIVTEEGFKVIEINSHQDISWFQCEKPLLTNNKAAMFFRNRMS